MSATWHLRINIDVVSTLGWIDGSYVVFPVLYNYSRVQLCQRDTCIYIYIHLFNPEVEAPIAGPGGGGGGVGGLGGGVAGVSSGGGGAGPMSVELRVHVVPNANALF